MQNNGTIWAHIFFTKPGKKPVAGSKDIILRKVVCKRNIIIIRGYKELTPCIVLNKYLPKPKEVTKKNLITGEEETVVQTDKVRQKSSQTSLAYSINNSRHQSSQIKELVSYWKGNLTLNLLQDHTEYKRGSIPPPIAPRKSADLFFFTVFVLILWRLRVW